jgi:hypothetical protein
MSDATTRRRDALACATQRETRNDEAREKRLAKRRTKRLDTNRAQRFDQPPAKQHETTLKKQYETNREAERIPAPRTPLNARPQPGKQNIGFIAVGSRMQEAAARRTPVRAGDRLDAVGARASSIPR